MKSKTGVFLFLPLLAVGLVSFIIVRSQQGEGATLIARQQHAEALTPAKVAAIVRIAPSGIGRERGRSARCVPLGTGELHNPWQCTIDYPSGHVVQYRVILNANGSYIGDNQVVRYQGHTSSGSGQISGCCAVVP